MIPDLGWDMDIQKFLNSSKHILLFLGQFIILMFCIWYIEVVYYNNIYPDKKVKTSFSQTSCTILNKSFITKGSLIKSYRADFLVQYIAGNHQYTQWISANGLDRSFTTRRSSQEIAINHYQINTSYPCWYNPMSPGRVALVLRHNWSSTFPLFLPSLIAAIMIYYLAQSIFTYLGENAIKTREKIRERKRKK